MEDLHVQDNDIGNTMYTLIQFHFKTTLLMNYIVCSWYDIYFRLEHSWWLAIPQLNCNHKIMKQYSLYSEHLVT